MYVNRRDKNWVPVALELSLEIIDFIRPYGSARRADRQSQDR